MQMQGKRRRWQPKERYLDNIREDMKKYNIMTEEMADNGSLWNMKMKAGTLIHAGGRLLSM